jgi:F-type H+-transporting ATPase subunit delta
LNLNGLAPTVGDGAEPGELPKEQSEVTGQDTIVSGMAGRYATALFELAREQNAIDPVKVDLDRFEALVTEVADLARLLRSPVFSAEEQTRALSGVLDRAGIDGLAANVLKLLGTNRRLFAALDMARAYRALVAKHKGEVTAEVTLAEQPSEAHLAAIKDALAAVTKKNVQMKVKVEPSIIGGLVVKLGSRMVDSSLRTKLNAIKVAMKEAR